jgi:hypothetical protein
MHRPTVSPPPAADSTGRLSLRDSDKRPRPTRSARFLVPRLFAVGALAAALAGCEKAEEIQHYRALKPEVLLKTYYGQSAPQNFDKPAAAKDRLLAAMVPHGSQLWFFKLVGPSETVTQQNVSFATFLASIRFADAADAPPEWTLPNDWRQQPGAGGRFATLTIGADSKPLELTVTVLPKPAEAEDQFVLSNVNRWRGQMGLRPIGKDQLAQETHQTKIGGELATIVGLVGRFQTGGMGRPPFAAGSSESLPAGHPPVESPASEPPAAEQPAADAPTFDAPSLWQPGQTDNLRKAAFVVRDGSRMVEIKVVALPSFAGDLLANVNRWRGQIHLPDTTQNELAPTVKQLPLGDVPGNYVELRGPADASPRETILAVMAARGDKIWFLTLKGDSDLAEREKPRFESFVKSVRFGPPAKPAGGD